MSSIILEPVNSKIYSNSNLEPQYFTYREPNTALIYLDSQDNTLQLDKTNMQMSSIIGIGDNPSILASGINRVGIASAGIYYNIPNVNPRNNEIKFFSSASGLFHTINVPEGFYKTPTDLITAIVATLNTATGLSGLTFSFVAKPLFDSTFFLNSAGGNYYISLDCTGVKNGYQLWNLPIEQIASNSKIIGSMDLFYTKYVDICCPQLLKYSKLKTVTTSKSQDTVCRLFILDPTKIYIVGSEIPRISYNFLSTEPIYSLEFTLVDQFGNQLYTPSGSRGTAGGFYWNIQLLVSI